MFHSETRHRHKSGFTLIEVSMVLVVIGLFIGGLFVGQDLIKIAQLKHSVSDVQELKTAIASFELKYNCLPGDCSNESKLFSMASVEIYGGNANFPDGNGNGVYDYWNEGVVRIYEVLSKAGLIGGTYTGLMGNGLSLGVNTPNYASMQGLASTSSNGANTLVGLTLAYNSPCAQQFTGCELFQGWVVASKSGKNQIVMVAFAPSNPVWWASQQGVNCKFASLIDTKLDDGMPVTGSVRTFPSNNASNCLGYNASTGISPPASTPYLSNNTTYSSPMAFDLGM